MSTEESSYGSLMKLMEKLETARTAVFQARSPEQIQAAEAQFARISNQMKNTWSEIDEDVRNEFSAAYKAGGGTGAPDRRYREKAWRSRRKSAEVFNRSADSVKDWGLDFSANERTIKARKAYDATIKDMEQRGAPAKEIQKMKNIRNSLKDGAPVPDQPSVTYFRKNGFNYRVPATHHMKMSVNTAYSINRNLGTVAAAAQGSGFVIVSDGPDCGKRGHKSPDKVNGQVWSVDDAFSFPISHPSCQRSFIVADGPPGSRKLRAQMKAIKDAAKGNVTVRDVANVAATASIVASIGGSIVTNPFVKRAIREILMDSQLSLSDFTKQILTGLTSYQKKEAIAFEMHGAKLGLTTQEQFNQRILLSFDEDFANSKFIGLGSKEFVTLRAEQAQVLGIPFRSPKSVVLSALDDYGDWALHRDSLSMPLENRIGVRQLWRDVNERLHSDAALKFHIDKAPGVQLDRNWARVIKDFKTAYVKDPEKAKVELVRLSASVFDPTPWLRIPLPNKFHFIVGMPSRGRQDLAEKIYRINKGLGSLTTTEIKWAEDLGMDLSEFAELKFTKSDLYDMLSPRLTYMPGKVFHATMGMDRGVLKPIIRMYPRGTFARFVSLEQRLGKLDVREFVRQLERVDISGTRPERIFNALVEAGDATFTSAINFFRNSPLAVSLKMNGAHATGAALRILPDNDFLRYSYHFTFDNTAYYMGKKMDELRVIAETRGLTGEYSSKSGLVKALRKWDGIQRGKFMSELKAAQRSGSSVSAIMEAMDPEVRRAFFAGTDGWQEGLSVLPNRSFGFNLHNLSFSQKEIILKLRVAGYSAVRIAKETRYGYDTILEVLDDAKIQLKQLKTFTKNELDAIHSFKDLGERISYNLGRNPSRVDRFAFADTDLSFADPALLQNPVMKEDLMRFRTAWDRAMPGIPVPEVRISDLVYHPMMERDGIIYIRSDVAEDWGLYAKLRRKGVAVGHFPADTHDATASLFHEAAHTIVSKMSRRDKQRLLVEILDSYQAWPQEGGVKLDVLKSADARFLEKWFEREDVKQMIARRVSGYGSTNIDEMLSEAFSEYMTSPKPRRIADTVGKFLSENAPRASFKADAAKSVLTAKERELLTKQNSELYMRLYDTIPDKNPIFVRDALGESKTWWWLEDVDGVDMSDLELEKVLADHPQLGDDVGKAFRTYKTQFPDLTPPRFARLRYSRESYDEFLGADQLNMSSAFYTNSNKTVYIPEVWFDNYGDAIDLRRTGELTGWAPPGTSDHYWVLVHEMGHHVSYSMTRDNLTEMFHWMEKNVANSDEAVRTIKNQIKGLSMAPGTMSIEELLGSLNKSMQQGGFPSGFARVSGYGESSFTEYFAEMFSLGMHDLQAGFPSTTAAQFVKMLAGLGITG